MTTVKQFQNKVRQRLLAAELEFDKIDSYGKLVSAKLRADRLQQAPKMYAYEVLDALHQGEIYDFFKARDMDDGQEYLVIRFTPGNLEVPYQPPRFIWRGKRGCNGSPAPKAATAEAPKPKPVPAPRPNGPATKRSYRDLGCQPQPEAIAWTLIRKKNSSQLKQARCRVLEVSGDRAEVQITKTGKQLRVPVSQLFDHVPRLQDRVWQ